MAIAPVETITNLAPSIVGNGTWAEVRRNYFTANPDRVGADTSGIAAWHGGGTSSTIVNVDSASSVSGRATRQSVVAKPANDGNLGPHLVTFEPARAASPSGRVTVEFSVRAQYSGISMSNLSNSGTLTVIAKTPNFMLEAGVTYRVFMTFEKTTPYVVTDEVRFNPRQPAGDSWSEIFDFVAYPGDLLPGGYFSGTFKDLTMDKPEDFRVRWLGAVNASTSVMEGERVQGLPAASTTSAWIKSTKNGKPAARAYILLSTGNPAGIFTIPVSARASGTIVAAKVQDKVLSSIYNSYNIAATNPQQNSPRTNQIGEVTQRLNYSALTSSYTAYLQPGALDVGESVWWTDIGLFAGIYDGPFFDGDSEPFLYKGELVHPFWDGEPNNSTSSFHYYDLASHKVPHIWNRSGEKFFESGIDRVVFYDENYEGTPWSGITSIKESPVGASSKPTYLEGVRVSNILTLEEFEATISAYQAPKEFGIHDGSRELYNGLFLGQQPRKPFHLTYRSRLGNDIDGSDHSYKIHLVYNALAEPTEIDYKTVSASIDPAILSWKISTVPLRIPGFKPTAHLVVDVRKLSLYQLKDLEDFLYGTISFDPRMPTILELQDILS